MKSTQTKNKRQLLNYLVLTGLLLGSISVVSIPSVMAQSSEDTTSDIDRIYDDLEAQYTAILKSFGFSEPQLTESQEEELDAKLAPLDAEYDKIFANNADLTAEEESKVDELDKKYDTILKSYGFEYPELTEIQEEELDAKLSPLEEKFMKLEGHFDDEDHFESELSDEQNTQLDSLDEQYDEILREFGFVEPKLTEAQEEELEKRLVPLDAEYDRIEAEFEKQLEKLDAKYVSVLSEYGFVEPKLTEAQEEELEKRLTPLDMQYDEIYGDYEEYGEYEFDEDVDDK